MCETRDAENAVELKRAMKEHYNNHNVRLGHCSSNKSVVFQLDRM